MTRDLCAGRVGVAYQATVENKGLRCPRRVPAQRPEPEARRHP